MLLRNIREKPHEAGPLDRDGQFALMLGAHAGALACEQPRVRIQKLLERFRILIVYVFNIIGGKIALHVSSLRSVKVKIEKSKCKMTDYFKFINFLFLNCNFTFYLLHF